VTSVNCGGNRGLRGGIDGCMYCDGFHAKTPTELPFHNSVINEMEKDLSK
jgi:hypothetical protein